MQRRRLNVSRNAGLLDSVSALALIISGSLSPGVEQKGIRPITYRSTRADHLPAAETPKICVVGATVKMRNDLMPNEREFKKLLKQVGFR